MPPGNEPKRFRTWFLSHDRITTSVSLVLTLIILQRVLQLGRVVVFARLLGPEQYGLYTLGIFLVPLMATVASLGVPIAFTRYLARYQAQGTMRWFLKRTYYLTAAISVLMAAILLVRPSFFSRLLYGDPGQVQAIVVVALSIPGYLLIRNLIATFMGLKFFRAGSFTEFIQVVIYAILGIPLILVIKSALGGLLGFTLSTYLTVAAFGALLAYFLRTAEPEYRVGEKDGFHKNLLKFSLWFVVTPVLAQVFHYIDRLSLQHLKGAFDQGVYSATVNMAETISAFGLATSNVIYPHVSATWESGNREKALRNLDFAIRVTTVVLLALGFVLVILGKWLVLLLLGDKYVPGVQALPYLVVYYIFTIIVWLFGVYPMLIERTYISAIGLVIALPANIVLNQVLIPVLGMTGAGLATMLSYLTMWIIIVAMCGAFGLRLPGRTLGICLLPLVLLVTSLASAAMRRLVPSASVTGAAGLVPDAAGILAVAAVFYVCLRRTWILSAEERELAYAEIRRVIPRVRRMLSRKGETGRGRA